MTAVAGEEFWRRQTLPSRKLNKWLTVGDAVGTVCGAALWYLSQEDDDDKCERAKAEARDAYYDLKARERAYNTSRTPDAGHYGAITQAKDRLRNAINAVRRWCRVLPQPEFPVGSSGTGNAVSEALNMTIDTIPKFLLQEHNFLSLSEKEKSDVLDRYSYAREISKKEIRERENTWSYILSLQIDVWSALSNDREKCGGSVLSIERWAAYADPAAEVRSLAQSPVKELYKRIPDIKPDDREVRLWLNDWANSLAKTLDMAEVATDPDEGLISFVAIHYLLHVAMAFFSALRILGFRG